MKDDAKYLADIKRSRRLNQAMMDIRLERGAQLKRWGPQNHPDGTSNDTRAVAEANALRAICDAAAKDGRLTWRHILREEVAEAMAEVDPKKLRRELVQVAAVCVAWLEAIDARGDV